MESYGNQLFSRLVAIDKCIRKGKCFYKQIGIVSEFEIDDPNTPIKLENTLKISNGELFHIGFGTRKIKAIDGTTVDIHKDENGFNLKERSRSIRIKRKDVLSNCVNGDLFYLGAINGDLLVFNHKDCKLITTYTGDGGVHWIQTHQDCICFATSNNSLIIIGSSDGKTRISIPLQTKSPIVGLQSYGEDLCCITRDGAVNFVDVKEPNLKSTINLGYQINVSPLIKDDLLYSFEENKVRVWDLKKNKEVYVYRHPQKNLISALTVFGEYVFVATKCGSISVLDRVSGEYISTIYPEEVLPNFIQNLKVHRGVLYAYSHNGELLMFQLDKPIHPASATSKHLLRMYSHESENIPICSLTGPNRIIF